MPLHLSLQALGAACHGRVTVVLRARYDWITGQLLGLAGGLRTPLEVPAPPTGEALGVNILGLAAEAADQCRLLRVDAAQLNALHNAPHRQHDSGLPEGHLFGVCELQHLVESLGDDVVQPLVDLFLRPV
jgi:hypothetical protein